MTGRRVVVTARDGFPVLPIRILEGLVADGHAPVGVLLVRLTRREELRRARRRRRGRTSRYVARAVRRRAADVAARAGARGNGAEGAVAPVPETVEAWAGRHGVPCTVVGAIDAPGAIAAVQAARPDVVVYAGGGIIGRRLLDVAPVVLNHHIGPLPAVRGNDPLEWSLLLGHPVTVTIHRIDPGIDTGAVIEATELAVQPDDDLAGLLERAVAVGVAGLRRAVSSGAAPEGRAAGGPLERQCFRIAPVLCAVAEARLAERRGAERTDV